MRWEGYQIRHPQTLEGKKPSTEYRVLITGMEKPSLRLRRILLLP